MDVAGVVCDQARHPAAGVKITIISIGDDTTTASGEFHIRVPAELIKVGVFPGLKYLLHRFGVIATPVCRKPLATLSHATSGRLDDIAEIFADEYAGHFDRGLP